MDEEIWAQVDGFYGRYWISSFGRVWSNISHKFLSPTLNPKGYENLPIFKPHCSRQAVRVHRLVAEAFLPNPNALPEVNHKDENPLNNHASNLEWCTHQYNTAYGTNRMRAGEKLIGKNGGKKIAQYLMTGELVTSYPSSKNAGKLTGIDNGSISACARGKLKQAGKYMWRFYSGDRPPDKIQMHRSKCYIPVCACNDAQQTIKTFPSITAAAKQIHCSETKMHTAIRKHKKCEGFYWNIYSFKED